MIPKMTSHELNNILNNANNKLTDLVSSVEYMKKDMSKKLKIMRYESEFMEEQMNSIKNAHKLSVNASGFSEDSRVFVIPDGSLSSAYEAYGCTLTPKFKNLPTNLFNILTTATNEAFYRDIAEVAINGVAKEEYKNILKHDSLNDKELFFEELPGKNPTVEISITLDKTKTLGSSMFNMIEFDMFLNGSYDIEYVKIYKQDIESDNEELLEYDMITNMTDTGKMRLLLNQEYSFNKVDIKIIPKFHTQINGADITPIGIKHIYFYNAKMLSDSYVIAAIESPAFIDKIENTFSIVKPNETIEMEADKEGIEFYLNCKIDADNNVILSVLQEPNTLDNIKTISMNVKTIYAKIPLSSILSYSKKDELVNQSITGFIFNISSKLF